MVTIVFDRPGDFEACNAAEKWCRDRGCCDERAARAGHGRIPARLCGVFHGLLDGLRYGYGRGVGRADAAVARIGLRMRLHGGFLHNERQTACVRHVHGSQKRLVSDASSASAAVRNDAGLCSGVPSEIA